MDHYHYSSACSALKSIEIYYANADDIGVNLRPVKIKHMANHR